MNHLAVLLLALTAHLNYCPAYHVRGMEYDICGHGAHPGFYVAPDYGPYAGKGYRVSFRTWTRSQTDTTWGDDERLGA